MAIGRIYGGDFRVRGQVEFASDGSATLMSGAQVEIRSGTARVDIPGGRARLCGGMRGSVLKSANPSTERGAEDDRPLLFAIDNGIVEVDYNGTAAHAVQTPYFSIATVPLAERQAREFTVRVDASGFTCVAASLGSLRVREQMGAAEMMIPAGRAMMIPSSGVEKASAVDLASCGCPVIIASPPAGSPETLADVARAHRATGTNPSRRVYTNDDLAPGAASIIATAPAPAGAAAEPAPNTVETKTTIAAAPLTFNAEEMAKAAPPKEAEVTLPVVTAAPPPLAAEAQRGTEKQDAAGAGQARATPAKPHRSFGARIKSFFKALFGYK